MSETSEFENLPEPTMEAEATGVAEAEAPRHTVSLPGTGNNGVGQYEMAGLVLLLNTVLGGLGTLYLTTKSVELTMNAALLTLLLTVVVLVVRHVAGSNNDAKGDRGGR
ncbi:hypothetical protein ACIQK6_38570 [Streptomyces sp. NPDC091682]|uniref:hypothetical protein n=1 Tax=Streptomyces sp. NPDC091682 TaxID=3366005 RepID=UPI003811989A